MKMLLLLILFPLFSGAAVDVAFVEIRNYNGDLLQLEPNGQFAHIAISYKGKWLHSHPYRGVEIVSMAELEKIGTVKEILPVFDLSELDRTLVETFLGKPYDANFSWDDESIYCSELIGKLLRMEPEPMQFKAEVWPEQFQKFRGKLGLSPDDIYKILSDRRPQASHSAKYN
jgi:hypothetical protein